MNIPKRQQMLAAMQLVVEESVRIKRQVFETQGDAIVETAMVIARALGTGRKLFLFGNGGSAADAQHMAAEFVNRFQLERPPLPAIALTVDSSILTSIGNDFSFDEIFLKQLRALAEPDDVALGISTSGRSKNVIEALHWARENDLHTVGWAGQNRTEMDSACEFILHVPSATTARIQEVHIMVGHILCQFIEEMLYGQPARC